MSKCSESQNYQEALKTQRTEYDGQIATLNNELQQLQNSLQTMNANNKNFDLEIASLMTKLRTATDAEQAAASQLEFTKQEAHEQVSSLASRYERMASQYQCMQSELDTKQSEIENLHRQYEILSFCEFNSSSLHSRLTAIDLRCQQLQFSESSARSEVCFAF